MKQKLIRPGLWEMIRTCRKSVIALSCLNVVMNLLQVLMAILMKYVIDAALSGNGKLLFWGSALVLDLCGIVGVYAVLNWFSSRSMDRYIARLRRRLLRAAAYSRDEKLQAYHSGEMLSRGMEDVNTVCDGTVHLIPSLVGQVTRLVGSFGAIALVYPSLALVLLAIALVVGGVIAWLRPIIKKRQKEVRRTEEQVLTAMQEDLQQLELIQSLQVQPQILERFHARIQKNLRARFRRRVWSVSSNVTLASASQLGSGALLLWGAGQLIRGAMSYGTLTAMLQLLSLFRGPALGISGQWTRLATVEVAYERLQDMLSVEQISDSEKQSICAKAVVFENVTFHYPGDETPVMENFSARFDLGSWVCLTGISGKGKSTMFKLMLGLYTPQQGRVYIQTDTQQIPCSEQTRHLFAYVPQDYALFSGTILENLQLTAPDADMPAVEEALRIADAQFVWELTGKEQTQVRENNTGLSKGQLQRIAIARAVLMDRQIFLLDECTSALDAHTENAVLRNLKQQGKQAILVTHRPQALDVLDGVEAVALDR